MTVADTNVVLRILLGDEPRQAQRAAEWLTAQPDMSVLLCDAVLVELTFILESKRLYALARADYIPNLLELLSAAPWCISALTWQALEIFAVTKLDYADCLLAAMYATGESGQVATFDKALQRHVKHATLA